jgi:hypothetical protein
MSPLKEWKMTSDPPRDYTKTQSRLQIILVITIVVSLFLRLTVPGWGLIVAGIFLVIIAILHAIVQSYAIRKIPETKAGYAWLILASDLFFFLGFVLQADGGDSDDVRVPLFFGTIFDRSTSVFLPLISGISLASFLALFLSWLLLLVLRKNVFKERSPEQSAPIT